MYHQVTINGLHPELVPILLNYGELKVVEVLIFLAREVQVDTLEATLICNQGFRYLFIWARAVFDTTVDQQLHSTAEAQAIHQMAFQAEAQRTSLLPQAFFPQNPQILLQC
jgi:hypothetical protein